MTTDRTNTAAATATGDDLLAGFLATRDAACPTCGYNLRGVVSSTCPECGAQLQLGVKESDGTLGRRWSLLLLLFCWLLLAGSMNDYRAIRTIHRTVTARQNLAWISTFNLQTQPGATGVFTVPNIQLDRSLPVPAPPAPVEIGLIEPTPEEPVTETVEPSDTAEELLAEEQVAEEMSITIGTADGLVTVPPLANVERQFTFRTPNIAVTAPQSPFFTGTQPPSNWSWSSVSWSLWASAAWWTALALAAATGLGMLLWYRRRPVPQLAARTLTLIAWGAFCGYFGYHLVSFVRELA